MWSFRWSIHSYLACRFIRRVGPVRNASGNEVWLFELEESNPAAWVTPLIAEAGSDAILATVMNPSFDVRRAALFDSSVVIDGAAASAAPPPLAIAAKVKYQSPRQISVELGEPAPQGSALVVSENWYPGWYALVNGRAAPAARADYTLIGVPLPAGARRVQLLFDDPVYERGKLITTMALLLTLLLIAAGVVMERRRRA